MNLLWYQCSGTMIAVNLVNHTHLPIQYLMAQSTG
jgi:hypothetical protein